MKKKVFFTMCTVVSVYFLSSCATIVTGTKPKVTINGNAKEPVTITTSYMTYENVILPTQVRVNRKHLSGQRISVKSPNYTYNDIVLDKKINGWAWGNLLAGGLIGWIIDLGTNCVSEPREYQYYVHGEPKTERDKEESYRSVSSSSMGTLLSFPCYARVERKNGEKIKCVINTMTSNLINITEKDNGKTYNIETRALKEIRFNIEDSQYQRPLFPCRATISLVNQFPKSVTLLAIQEEQVVYEMKGKTYIKPLEKVEGIGFLYSESMEKYGCDIYFYEKKSL